MKINVRHAANITHENTGIFLFPRKHWVYSKIHGTRQNTHENAQVKQIENVSKCSGLDV